MAEIRTVGPSVRASIEMRQVFSEKFRQIVQSGGALHVRVQAELWEDRPLWDRLVRPALVTVFPNAREPASACDCSTTGSAPAGAARSSRR